MSAPTGALAVLGRRRRVIEGGSAHPPRSSETAPWVSGALAAIQAALLSLALIIVPTVAAYVATSADPSNVGTTWTGAVGVASRIWLLGHGTPLAGGTDMITLIPLGLTILLAFSCYASARRTSQAAWSAIGTGVGAYVVVALFVALLSGARTPGQIVLTVLGATLVAGAGLGLGAMAGRDSTLWLRLVEPVRLRLPPVAVLAVRGGVLATAWLMLAASLLFIAWVFMGRSRALDVIDALSLGMLDGTILAVGQAMYAANVVVWAMAWLIGPGFIVGTGSLFAPTEVISGPMPALPILGALPAESMATPVTAYLPLLVVLCGVAAGLYVRRRSGALTWSQVAIALGVTVGVAGIIVGAFAGMSGGGIGPGRMSQIGPDAVRVAGVAMLEVAVGAAIVLVLFHESTRQAVAYLINWRTWHGWFNRATSSTIAAPPVAVSAGAVPAATASGAASGAGRPSAGGPAKIPNPVPPPPSGADTDTKTDDGG